MLPSCLVPQRVLRESSRRDPELVSNEGDHRFRRMLATGQALSGMPQQAQLDGKAEPIVVPTFGPDERRILGAQHVALGHLGGVGWNCRTDECAVRTTGGFGGTSRP